MLSAASKSIQGLKSKDRFLGFDDVRIVCMYSTRNAHARVFPFLLVAKTRACARAKGSPIAGRTIISDPVIHDQSRHNFSNLEATNGPILSQGRSTLSFSYCCSNSGPLSETCGDLRLVTVEIASRHTICGNREYCNREN